MFVSLSPFGHCTVCPSSVDGFLLSTWHFQTFLNWTNTNEQIHSLTNQLSWEQCYRLLMNLKLSPCEFESRLLRGVIDTLICAICLGATHIYNMNSSLFACFCIILCIFIVITISKISKIVTNVKLGIKGLVPIDITSMAIPIAMTGLRPSLFAIKTRKQ
jgi:hypothetical protein